ncbi:uncharacterized protein LOC119364766 [Triticum dicoccoides]|uniref:uncharacterized protein LOC119364766 n=1 Tax=Triticum dicoccoides TaxID=85692 RepID=UPI00188FE87F|nr:uncharacterized protein LOC119364766 [Triticum dicoccoides]
MLVLRFNLLLLSLLLLLLVRPAAYPMCFCLLPEVVRSLLSLCLIKSVIAVIFLGVLEKAWLGMWGHAMAEAHVRQEESGRHEGGHVDVIVALTHFSPPMLYTRGHHLYISSSEGDLVAHGEAIQGEDSRFCAQPLLPIKGGEVVASMPSALGRWCCASAAGIMQGRWEATVPPLPPSSKYMIAASR